MSRKTVPALILALVILLIAAVSVTACSVWNGSAGSPATPAVSTVSAKPGPQITMDPDGPSFTPNPTGTPAPTDDSWKEKFEADLKENYGVTVDHYEFVGGTSYQVYVKINDEMVPYVCVDSATGNYHG